MSAVPTPYRNQYKQTLTSDDDIAALEIKEGRRKAPDEPPADPLIPADVPEPAVQNVEEDNYRKRYGDLRRYLAARETAFNARVAELEKQIMDQTRKGVQLPASEEEVTEWMKTYPDVARTVETIAIKRAQEAARAVEGRLMEVERRERAAARRSAEIELRRVHPDLDQIKVNPAFGEWASQQPAWIQQALFGDHNDWQSCARAIDLYKADVARANPPQDKRGPGRPRKDEQAAAAEVVNVRERTVPAEQFGGKRIWKESEVRRLRGKEFDRYEDEINEARREGRLVYDLTQAAS